MLVDSFFEQGVTHEVCEDYARHGYVEYSGVTGQKHQIDYAVLSDGCSNGGGPRADTDWGARILCSTAESAIDITDPLDLVFHTVSTAKSRHATLLPSITPQSMCATLLVLRSCSWGSIQAILSGDGVTGGRRRDGMWVIHNFEFLPGGKLGLAGPYYLKYFMFSESEQWAEAFGRSFVTRTYTGNLFDPNLNWPNLEAEDRVHLWQSAMSCEEKFCEWDIEAPFECFDYPVDEYDFVFIASDGPSSFYTPTKTATSKHNTPLHFLDSLRVLLDIQTFRPGFLRQQRHWNFKQDRPGTFRRRNWLNGDDVSMGAIYCGQ